MTKFLIAVLIILSFGAGLWLQQQYPLFDKQKPTDLVAQSAEKKPLYWVAPMDRNYRRDAPGKSPMGMDLIPVYEESTNSSDPAGTVKITPTVENNLGVRIAPVVKQDLSRHIETVGYIQFDEEKLTHFHSRVDGWIESLNVNTVGDRVKKGQKLFELYAPQLVNAQEEYLMAIESGSLRLMKASEEKLLSLGVSKTQILSVAKNRKVIQKLGFHSNREGYVANLSIREGAYIKPATEMLAVGDLSSVWVIAEVFERQADWVKEGQKVTMRSDSFPGRSWLGLVDYVYPILEIQTRTVRVRVVFDNKDQALKPNMFVTLDIESASKSDILTIPREAIIYNRSKARVVKALGDGKYRSVLIETGIESGRLVEVKKGLQETDRVVISAQFLIDSESSINADLSRLEEPEAPPPSSVAVTGVINSIKPELRLIEITHDPIEAWQWPTMTMMFLLAEDIDSNALTIDEKIQFSLLQRADGDYEIRDPKPLNQNHHHDHNHKHH